MTKMFQKIIYNLQSYTHNHQRTKIIKNTHQKVQLKQNALDHQQRTINNLFPLLFITLLLVLQFFDFIKYNTEKKTKNKRIKKKK